MFSSVNTVLCAIGGRLCASVLVAGAVAASGCAGIASQVAGPASPEEKVAELANARWAHLIDDRWDQAYAMLTPAYRALHSSKEYQKSFGARPVTWKKATVASVMCEAEKCEAKVELEVVAPLARGKAATISTFIAETWLLEAGSWYHYEKP